MDEINFKVRLNPGRKGVSLNKLSKISSETERFLRLLSEDLKLKGHDKHWIAFKFENRSLSFRLKHPNLHPNEQIEGFNSAMLLITGFDPDKKMTLNGYRKITLRQFAKIADPLESNEIIKFGVFPALKATQFKWKELTKLKAEKIEHYISESVESYGALQGKIYSFTLGKSKLEFEFRDLASGSLIKCFSDESLYDNLVNTIKDRDSVVHLSGKMKVQRIDRKIEHIFVDRIELAEKFLDGDLKKFFGCAPGITGDLSTKEYISQIRSDENVEGQNLH